MDDEFALCWNNFHDNITTGFQSLYDRGDLVDVTLACDGKLLQAHKIVLAICSPYFQEMFITNPCKHPIIVLKDVGYGVMCELLQFMYQGVVNVKHTELPSFMKMAQTLQIKGLTTSATQKSPNQNPSSNNNNSNNNNNNNSNNNNSKHSGNVNENPSGNGNSDGKLSSQQTTSSSKNSTGSVSPTMLSSMKRDFSNSSESVSIYPKKLMKRNLEASEHDINNDSIEHNMNPEDVFLPPIPQISMVESRFDLNSVKRELADHPQSPGNMRNSLHPFNFEYNNMYSNKSSLEYPNDLHIPNEFQKGAGNHMDIPPGSSITMLSSTSLLHGNCIFNRNNTVATQQGMKTYWLCKAYRITMCRARCITHQGRVISATGVHNHPPHMKSSSNNEFFPPIITTQSSGGTSCTSNNNTLPGISQSGNCIVNPTMSSTSSSASSSAAAAASNMRISQSQHQVPPPPPPHPHPHQLPPHSHQPTLQQLQPPPSHHGMQGHSTNNATMFQNMMHNVLSQNNLMHLTNMAPMLNPLPPQHSGVGPLNNLPPPTSLQITPVLNSSSTNMNSPNMNSPNLNSPPNRTNSHSHSHTNQIHSPSLQQTSIDSPNPNNVNHNGGGIGHGGNNSNTHPNNNSSMVPVPTTSSPKDSHDSSNTSQSSIMDISISPQTNFKMEHM